MSERFYSRNGWDLISSTIDKKTKTITFHIRKGLRSKDIKQSLSYWVRFGKLPEFLFND